VFSVFLLLQNEVWQITATLPVPFVWLVTGSFGLLALLFLLTQIPQETKRLSEFTTWEETIRLAAGTPMEGMAVGRELAGEPVPLSRRQRGNVSLVVLVSQGLQILLVTALMAAFFVGFGLAAIETDVVRSWTGGAPHVLLSFDMWGRTVTLTSELLRVALFLASFSGLYFAVNAVTDDTYREAFNDHVVAEIRQAFAVRRVYLVALEAQPRAGQ
jgi:hypothetical protein